ncbi:hypothetical protein, partial [Dolichospermum circinale]|uniref:hypothetical protein n=1 Tax=Dolichospermum circinale TaxID=109265 RepID=UPI001E48D1A0
FLYGYATQAIKNQILFLYQINIFKYPRNLIIYDTISIIFLHLRVRSLSKIPTTQTELILKQSLVIPWTKENFRVLFV